MFIQLAQNKKSLLLSSILLALSSTNCLADSEDEVGEMSLEDLLNISVETASRTAESAKTAPGTIVVVRQQEIHERGYRNLQDLLRDMPSVDVQVRADGFQGNLYSIRGITGNNKFIILQDGVRISSPTGESIPIDENFPLFHLKQVEIVYGPASAIYGADAFTGVINLITYNGKEHQESTAGAYIGEDNYKYSYFQFRHVIGENVGLSVGGHIHEADNQDLSKEYPNQYVLGDLQNFAGVTFVNAANRVGYKNPSESHSINVRLDVGDDFSMGFFESNFQQATAQGNLPEHVDYGQNGIWDTTIDTTDLKKSFALTSTINSTLQLSYSRYEVDNDTFFANRFTDFNRGYKYSKGTRSDLSQQFDWKMSDNHNLLFGYTYQNFDSLPKTSDLEVKFDENSAASAQNLTIPGTDGQLPSKIFEVSWTNLAGFAQWQGKWSESFSTTAGIRYDDSSTYGQTLNPRLGFVWSPEKRFTAKVFYGEAFLAPAPFFSFDHFGSFVPGSNHFTIQPDPNNPNDTTPDFQALGDTDGSLFNSFFFHIPNPDLEPEEMQTLEANLSWLVTSNLHLGLVVYHEEVTGLIEKVITANPVSDFIPGGVIATTEIWENVGDLSADGADLSISYQTNIQNMQFKAWTSYSYVNGNLKDNNGNSVELPQTAKNKIKLGSTLRWNEFFITPTVYIIGDTVSPISPTNVKGYTVANLYTGYDNLVEGLSLYLKVNNLFDKHYLNSGDAEGETFVGVPQDTRWFQAGASYSF